MYKLQAAGISPGGLYLLPVSLFHKIHMILFMVYLSLRNKPALSLGKLQTLSILRPSHFLQIRQRSERLFL